MIEAHRIAPAGTSPGVITFLAVMPATPGSPAAITAIRVNDIRTQLVDDAVSLEVVPDAQSFPAGLDPVDDEMVMEVLFCQRPVAARASRCAEVLNRVLEDATLAAWNVEETLADLRRALGDSMAELEWGQPHPLDVSSMLRLASPTIERFEQACKEIDHVGHDDVGQRVWSTYRMARALVAAVNIAVGTATPASALAV